MFGQGEADHQSSLKHGGRVKRRLRFEEVFRKEGFSDEAVDGRQVEVDGGFVGGIPMQEQSANEAGTIRDQGCQVGLQTGAGTQ